MKSILISIHPKYFVEILSGNKTIEIRKTAPKCELPIDVYIYCTKTFGESHPLPGTPEMRKLVFGNHNVYYDEYAMNGTLINGKVVAKFTLRKVEKLERYTGGYNLVTILHTDSIHTCYSMEKKSCLSMDEIWRYTNGNGYAWHIDDLEIFDEPKDLSEFGTFRKIERGGPVASVETYRMEFVPLKKAPKSWQYVDKEE